MGKIGDGKDQQFKKDLIELESEIKTRFYITFLPALHNTVQDWMLAWKESKYGKERRAHIKHQHFMVAQGKKGQYSGTREEVERLERQGEKNKKCEVRMPRQKKKKKEVKSRTKG